MTASVSITWCFLAGQCKTSEALRKANTPRWLGCHVDARREAESHQSQNSKGAFVSLNLRIFISGLWIACYKHRALWTSQLCTPYSPFVTQGELWPQSLSFGHFPAGLWGELQKSHCLHYKTVGRETKSQKSTVWFPHVKC